MVILGEINTRRVLVKRGILDVNETNCPLCLVYEEKIYHVLNIGGFDPYLQIGKGCHGVSLEACLVFLRNEWIQFMKLKSQKKV